MQLCEVCEDRLAALVCPQCPSSSRQQGTAFCGECDQEYHARIRGKEHLRTRIAALAPLRGESSDVNRAGSAFPSASTAHPALEDEKAAAGATQRLHPQRQPQSSPRHAHAAGQQLSSRPVLRLRVCFVPPEGRNHIPHAASKEMQLQENMLSFPSVPRLCAHRSSSIIRRNNSSTFCFHAVDLSSCYPLRPHLTPAPALSPALGRRRRLRDPRPRTALAARRRPLVPLCRQVRAHQQQQEQEQGRS